MDNWIYSRDFPRGGMGITQIGLGIDWIFSTMNTMILPSQDLYSLLQTSEPHSRDSRSTNSLLQSEHIHFLPAVRLQKRGKLDESCLVYEHKPLLMTAKLLTPRMSRGWWRYEEASDKVCTLWSEHQMFVWEVLSSDILSGYNGCSWSVLVLWQ